MVPATGTEGERAVIWVSDDYRQQFIQILEQYATELTRGGNPKNQELVANIGRIRSGVGRSLAIRWRSAVAIPETVSPESRRVYCMPVTTPADKPGEPTLWSASVDALAAGVSISRDGNELQLLSKPDWDAARLFIISAGNVEQPFQDDYLSACDTSPVEDPAQSWNVLTVGAQTHLVDVPEHPDYDGYQVMADGGDLSPHSRTSVMFGARRWPIKPDICMEGGNVLTDGSVIQVDSHPLVSLSTTDGRGDLRVSQVNATSAATAQAARLAAKVIARYPDYWPETVRALLVHEARWTSAMEDAIRGAGSKTVRQSLLRRYGWGVPEESNVLYSSSNSVTIVSQDVLQPFRGAEHRLSSFALHRLPWPEEVLRGIGSSQVTMRVTLSYFIEPTASRRGWRRRYSYASHGLRFELKSPLESESAFIGRISNQVDEDEDAGSDAMSGRWLIGPNQRNVGSLHQDIWEGTGPELADCGLLAVRAVGGWWKKNARRDREGVPVRYSLIVSLSTSDADVDLYTPVSAQLTIPVAVDVAST